MPKFASGVFERRIIPYTPSDDSHTVPDMAYSVQDLLKRFTTGTIPSDIVRSAMYTDNPDFDDFIETELGDFDLTDYAREMDANRMSRRQSVDDRAALATPSAALDDVSAEAARSEAEGAQACIIDRAEAPPAVAAVVIDIPMTTPICQASKPCGDLLASCQGVPATLQVNSTYLTR